MDFMEVSYFRLICLVLIFAALQNAEAGKRRYFKYGGNWKSMRDQPIADDYTNWSRSRQSSNTGRRSLPDVRNVHQDTRDVPENSEVDLSCAVDRGRYPRIRWSRIGQPLPDSTREYDNRLLFRNIQLKDAGVYVCSASSDWDTREVHIKLTVQPSNRYRQLTSSVGQCRYDQSVCRSGECIDKSDICDGEIDCRDGSDEQHCGGGSRLGYLDASRECEPNEFKCNNGKCMQLMWRCDGDDDCGDNSDEQNCAQRQPGEICSPQEFKCQSQNQCVPLAYQCDKHNDCFDGSDEVGCTGPTVVEPPKREVSVQCGETIVLTCRTVGVPVPYVNWRLNWGPVCGPPRCTQTSVNGLGTLTIRNAQPSDQGAYTCEAVNVVNRLLVTPDAIVRVGDDGNCFPKPPTAPPITRLSVRVDPPFQEVDEATTARFRCIVQGGSGGPYTYSWSRVGYTHLPQNARSEGDTIVINNVHIEDYGTYRCSVSSHYGDSGSAEGELKVRRVGQCPYVWIEPDNKWAGPTGERVEFVCKAIGEPTPRVSWARSDGRPFDPNVVDYGDGRLVITNVGPKDYGVYVCTGENRAGKNTANATVGEGATPYAVVSQTATPPEGVPRPLTRLSVKILPSNRIASKRLALVTLTCVPTGDQPITLKWTREDGQPFGNNVQDLGNGELRIVGIDKENAGLYRCTATNPNEQAHDIAEILEPQTQKTPPPYVHIVPSEIEARPGDSGQFRCIAVTDPRDPPPALSWRYHGGPLPSGVEDVGGGVLRFPNLQQQHAGTYECTASTEFSRATATAPVRIRPSGQPPSTPIVTPLYTLARPGDRVTIHCESRGNPPPALRWGHSTADTPLRPGVSLSDNGTLVIDNVQEIDEGVYFCTATNPYGRAVSEPATVKLEKPSAGPRVWIEPVDHWTGRPGDNFEFQCRASGDPPPQLSWTREDGRPLGGNVQELGGGRLGLTRVSTDDAGRYICTAYNLAGTASAPATVGVEGGAPARPVVTPPFQTIPEGHPAQFQCTSSGSPPPTLTWGFQNERGQLRPGVRHEDGRIYIDRVTKADAGDYICTATNPYGSASAPGTLEVAKPPSLRVEPDPRWVGQPLKSHKFICISDDPDTRISWRRADGRPLDSNVRDLGDGTLEIDSYTPSNDGEYICLGETPVGRAETPARVVPPQEPPPVPEVTPKIQTIQKGDPVEFECKVDSVPPATLTWGFGSPNGALKSNARVEQGGSRLVIEHADTSDQGQYFCVATNPYGSNSAPGSLYVEEPDIPPKVTITPQKLWKGKPAEDFTFECTATGSPTPTIRWTRERENDFDPNVSDDDEGRLVISRAQLSNSGKYICTATNRAGKDSDTADVEVQGNVGVEIWYQGKIAKSPIYVPEGTKFELKCVGLGDPEPSIGWTVDMGPSRGDVPEGYKPVEIYNQFVRHDSFSRANEGLYKCNATNEYGSAEEMVRVLVAPSGRRQVVILGGSHRAAEVGTKVELRCLLTDTGPRYDLRWVRKQPSGASVPVRHEQRTEGTLIIQEFSRDDAGSYECQAWDEESRNVVSSADVSLTVVGEHDPQSVVEVAGGKIQTLNAGDTLELRCTAAAASTGAQSELRWQILDKGGFQPVTKGSVTDGTLRIDNVQLTDAGIYSCVRYLGEASDGASQVTVLVSNTETTAKKVTSEVGYAAEIHCPLYRISGLTYRWKRVNQPRLPTGAQAEGPTLRIPTFKAEHAGTYECEGRLNGARARGYVQLASEGALKLAAVLRPITPPTYQSASDPPYKPIAPSPYRYQNSYQSYQAPPSSYQPMDPLPYDNSYQSRVSSPYHHNRHKTVAVSSTSKPYIELNMDVTPDFVFPGQDVMFRCKVDGDPTARIRWERIDGPLPRTAVTSRHDLKIRKVQKSDAGRYACHAMTKIGEMTAHANLKLGQKVSGNTLRRYYRLRT